ncbi:MAG: hypothetical protein L0287_16770 [Anaerolineae bacterium]|nr:hypothetical protein [Anaerolineae bacterium]MCI0609488.1 hypothetical protein [Anaerolineae bacterium]
MKIRLITSALLMGFVLLTACASPGPATPTLAEPATVTLSPQATGTVIITETPALSTPTSGSGASTAVPTLTLSIPSSVASNICTDPQVTALIDSLNTATLNSDGPLLSSLVSPQRGLDVAYFRNGTVINYRPDQAKFLFETTFEVNWGPAPGSGLDEIGSFHDVVVPELVKAFNQPYTLHCNELKHGGATYEVSWPYEGDFYSVYFPGTEPNGFLDWHTWGVGVEYVNTKPYLYALIPYFWEP